MLGYADQYTDPVTGLEYDQARWYDTASGQFMVVDPDVEGTWQAYAYADCNPEIGVDPNGQFGKTWYIGAASAIEWGRRMQEGAETEEMFSEMLVVGEILALLVLQQRYSGYCLKPKD